MRYIGLIIGLTLIGVSSSMGTFNGLAFVGWILLVTCVLRIILRPHHTIRRPRRDP